MQRITHSIVANNSWHDVLNDLNWYIDHGKGKKMYFDEVRRLVFTKRPSHTSDRMAGHRSRLRVFRITASML
jgi:hypothetical protein